MTQKLLSIAALSGLFVLGALSPVLAAPFKDATGKVHIQDSGMTIGQKVILGTDTPITKNVIYNQCGIGVLSAPSTTVPMPSAITVNGVSVDVASLPTGVVPKCTLSGGSFVSSIPVSANFKTADGKVGLIGTANTAAIVGYTGVFKTKSYTANKCALVSFGSLSSPAPATFAFNGTTYTTATLPIAIPARCIGGVKYVPAT